MIGVEDSNGEAVCESRAPQAIEVRGRPGYDGDAPEIGHQVTITVTGRCVGYRDEIERGGACTRRIAIVRVDDGDGASRRSSAVDAGPSA